MASPIERDLLAASVLPPVAGDAMKLGPRPVTAFLALRGTLYEGELMVVGRAVNEWHYPVRLADLKETGAITWYANAILRASTETDTCPMAWIAKSWGDREAKYDPRRSAFWRVIRELASNVPQAGASAEAWPSTLVWSNLYKVAPANGGNPGTRLQKLQFGGCVELLRMELINYQPRHVVFLTGLDWAGPFIEAIGTEAFEQVGRAHVQAAGRFPGRFGGSRFVVAKHPRGKNEAQWLQEVLQALHRAKQDS